MYVNLASMIDFRRDRELMLQPEFDRVRFYSYNKKAVLAGLSQRGRVVIVGSGLYEGIGRDDKATAAGSTGTTRTVAETSQASGSRANPASATSKSKQGPDPIAIRIASATMSNVSSAGAEGVNASIAHPPNRHSSEDPSASVGTEGAVTPVLNHLEEKKEKSLATIIDELDQWCLGGSKGSRTAYLNKMTEASVSSLRAQSVSTYLPLSWGTFNRAALFGRNRVLILQGLKDRGRDVSDGTKVFGINMYRHRDDTIRKNEGTVAGQASPVDYQDPSGPPWTSVRLASGSLNVDSSTPAVVAAGPLTHKTINDVAPGPSTSTSSPRQRPRSKYNGSSHRDQKKERLLKQIIQELHVWVRKGSPDSRSTYLRKTTEAKVSFTIYRTLPT